jgi:hypothetical protein
MIDMSREFQPSLEEVESHLKLTRKVSPLCCRMAA